MILQNRCTPVTPQVLGATQEIFSPSGTAHFAARCHLQKKKEKKKKKKRRALTQIKDNSESFFKKNHVLSRHKTVKLQLIITVLQKIVLQKCNFTFPLMFEGNENNTTVPSAAITANYCTPSPLLIMIEPH